MALRPHVPLLLVGGFVAFLAIAASEWPDPADDRRSTPQTATRPAPRVMVQTPKRQTIHRVIRLAADVVAVNQVAVEPMITGHVKAVNVDAGSRVAANDVLILLEAPELAAQVDAARAGFLRAANLLLEAEAAAALARVTVTEMEGNVEVARGALARVEAEVARSETDHGYRVLIRDRLAKVVKSSPSLVSQESVDEAQRAVDVARDEVAVRRARAAEERVAAAATVLRVDVAKVRVRAAEAQIRSATSSVEVAKADLRRAEATYAYTTLRAPFAGIVTERRIDPGNLVRASGSAPSALLRLVDASKMRVRFHVAEPDAPTAAPGRAFTLRVDEIGERLFRGVVARTGGALDLKTRTMLVEGEIENADGVLRHGMYGRVSLDLEEHPDALTVPAQAVTTVKGKSSVLVVVDGKVEKRSIKIGVDDGQLIEIVDGLTGSETVITSGGALVAPGDAAQAVPEKTS